MDLAAVLSQMRDIEDGIVNVCRLAEQDLVVLGQARLCLGAQPSILPVEYSAVAMCSEEEGPWPIVGFPIE